MRYEAVTLYERVIVMWRGVEHYLLIYYNLALSVI